jgi:HlyD family secretion protein
MNYRPTNKKRNIRWYILLGVLAAGILVYFVFFRGKGKDSTSVSAAQAAARTLVQTVSGTGKIYPETEVAITSDVSGTLVEMLVEEGDSVREGQLLCRIDADAIEPIVERTESAVSGARAQVATLQAQLRQAEAQLENARQVRDRNEQLFKDGVIAAADLDASRNAFNSAQATVESAKQSIKTAEFNVKSAEATVKESRENLTRTAIYAPMNGVVSKLNKKKGEQVVGTIQMAGTEIMRIANMNALEVRVDVSETEVLRVREGDTSDIEVDAYPGRKFRGIVTHIANSAANLETGALAAVSSDKVTNFVVKIHLLESSYADLLGPNRKAPFLPGMSAAADIRTETLTNVLSVPLQAVTTREADSLKTSPLEEIRECVFVVSGDTVSQRTVKTGIQDSEFIQVLSGLNAGETVVTGPYTVVKNKLKNGLKITVVDEKELFEADGGKKD